MLQSRAWESINFIAEAIVERRYPIVSDDTIRKHLTHEDAMLFAYLNRASGDRSWIGHSLDRMNEAIDAMASTRVHCALFEGWCGIGWTVEHLLHQLKAGDDPSPEVRDNDAIEAEDPNQELDDALVLHLQSGRLCQGYDLVSGLVGVGIYFLERWPAGRSIDGLKLIVRDLEDLADHIEPGIAWHSPPEWLPKWQREECPAGYYNLGAAHGIPGILYFLSEVVKLNIEAHKASYLLKHGTNWLIAQARLSEDGPKYTSWVNPLGSGGRDARPVWCYGDLGIATILLQIAEQTGSGTFFEFARDIANSCLNLQPEQYRIRDAGLCHGSAGVAHMFNRLYQRYGDPRYRNAALFWFEDTLMRFEPGSGVGGYSQFVSQTESDSVVWEPSAAFLDGSIGIALALLSSVTDVEPQWDRMLLLSSRHSHR